jgi:hypothetical protein
VRGNSRADWIFTHGGRGTSEGGASAGIQSLATAWHLAACTACLRAFKFFPRAEALPVAFFVDACFAAFVVSSRLGA